MKPFDRVNEAIGSPSTFLTQDELQYLTGRERPSAQIRWLRANGFEVLRRADGMPIVLRESLVAKMNVSSVPRHGASKSPNWRHLDG